MNTIPSEETRSTPGERAWALFRVMLPVFLEDRFVAETVDRMRHRAETLESAEVVKAVHM